MAAAVLACIFLVAQAQEGTPSTERPQRPSFDPARYGGGDGLSREKAVVILTTSHVGGVSSEYAWLREHYPDGKKLAQSVTKPIDAKRYDILQIEAADGRKLEIWFDITAFFPVRKPE